MAGDLVKFSHISSILIPKIEGVYEVSVVHQLLTTIDDFRHGFSFPHQELLYLRTLLGVVFLAYKGMSHEFQLINGWEISTQRYVLNFGNYIFFLGLDALGIRLRLSCLISPLFTKGRIPVMIHGAGIIF